VISRRDLLKAAGLLVAQDFSPAKAAAIEEAQDFGPASIIVTPASRLTTRLTISRAGGPTAIAGDGSLADRAWPTPAGRITIPGAETTTRSGDLTIVARDGIQIRAKDGRAIQDLSIDPQTGVLSFALGHGPIYGLGEGGPQFDRRGSTLGPRSGQGGYQLRTHGGRVPVQWIVGSSGWAMFVHQPYGTFDLTGSRGMFTADHSAPLPLDLFIVGATDPAAIMREYAQLTGFPELPPLWAFGYQQSHRTLASREAILQEAKTFREKKLPCETLIYLGTGFCPSGWNTDNGEFAFNKNVFPDPAAMISTLHDDHFKVVLHVVLEGRKLAGTVADPCTASPLPSGRTPDGRWPDDRRVSCYWPVHKVLTDVGVDGWWPDQGDGLDPASRLARNRMYWDGSRRLRPNERPFALHRNGGAGMQRYASFLWSGDVYSTWETLKTHVPVAINTGLSGITYWGTDIGGFVPTRELTGELYVRWFQFAAFCPLFRAHGRTWKLRLPWGWNTGDLQPDEIANYTGGAANPDPSELHNAGVEPICRTYLELRSRLMPYLYSVVREGHENGLPIIRALWLHYPGDRAASTRGDEYLWGRDVLVAPVVEKGATSRNVYLPAGGRWFDWWTGESHEGGRELSRAVDLTITPIYVRAGTILPLGPVRQYTAEPVDEPLSLQIYPGADGAFMMYEDDGVSFEHERGAWMGVDMRWTDRERRLELRLARGSRMLTSTPRRITVRLVGAQTTRDVTFTGQPLQVRL
jgi:alpha-glucosidase (family GH31 glycosyl hydrolase)